MVAKIPTNGINIATAFNPDAADGATLGGTALEWSDLYLADSGVIYFGNDQEVKLTHNADKGLILKHTATADDKPVSLTLQTGETDIAQDDVIGKIEFQAPDEGTGTDAILVAAGIQAVSEGDFSSSSNATGLQFLTGNSAAATAKMVLTSGGSGNEGRLGVGTTHPASGAGLDAFIEVQGGDPGIVLRDDTASDAVELYGAGGTFVVYTGSADALKIDSTGAVTKPLQPAFLVYPSSVQTNFAQGSTVAVAFGTERFDLNGDFASDTFTAPVTGKYRMDVSIKVNGLTTEDSATYYYWQLVTSNRTYYHLSSVAELGSGSAGFTFAGSILADMDASDTAVVQIIMSGTSGTSPSDISTDSYWSGNLVC
tara:strand:- start:277 stop:1383 length:1107 start_codon:yes stop_codon:yes gene_type:complete